MEELPKKLIAAVIHRESHYLDPKIFKKMLVQATLLPIALSLFLSVLFIQQVFNVLEENQKVRHSDEVINAATEAVKLVIDSETGFRGFIITDKPEYLEPWEKARVRFDKISSTLIKLTSDNNDQIKQVKKALDLYHQWNEKAEETLQYREKFKRDSPKLMVQQRKNLMDGIRENFDSLISQERTLRNTRWSHAEEASRKAIIVIIALGVFLGIVLALMSLFQLRRLSASYTTAYKSLSKATDHLEEVVAQRTHELVLVNKELEAFSYSVSHDLRAPLRGIDGFSQILSEEYSDKLDQEGKKYLQFIRSGVQRMGVLIDDLINLSRLTRAEFKKINVNLAEISGEIIKEFAQLHPERVFEFINFSHDELVQVDEGLMRAALYNLISNAWKYSSTKDVAKIELGKMMKDGNMVYYVKDNGVGFDMRFYDKLFQPFQRLHTKNQFEGTGIGLATVARIIRRHNGTIWGESQVGKGSVFYFTLG
jgi:signal transduction histidine kinase